MTLTASATVPGFNENGSGFDWNVDVVAVQPDGKVLAGGSFTSYNGNAATPDRFARLNSDGSLDSFFNAGGSGIAFGGVDAIAIQPNGKILVGGSFSDYNGTAVSYGLVRLNSDGSLDAAFSAGGAGFNDNVRTIAVQLDGKILVGGIFTSYNGNSATPDYLLRLNADGTLDTGFSGGPGFYEPNGGVTTVAVQADGKILAGGKFTAYNGSTVSRALVRLNTDGTLDTSFNTNGGGFSAPLTTAVQSVVVQTDGKIVVGGLFTSYNANTAAPRLLLRLNANGSLDTSFNSGGIGFSSDYVKTVAIDPAGKLLVGGYFSTYNGNVTPHNMVRINSNGTLDAGFNTGGSGFNSTVQSLASCTDGKVVVGGAFTSYNGSTAPPFWLVQLKIDGTINNASSPVVGGQYVFNPGNTSGPTRIVTSGGSYTATFTNANGCSFSSAPVVITVTAPPTLTWTGIVSTAWNTAGNWSTNTVPINTDDAVIPSGTPFQPTVTGIVPIHTVTINPGATVTLANSAVLSLSGDFVNNGSFVGTGTLCTLFFGGGTVQTVSGSSSTAVNTFHIGSGATGVVLNSPVRVIRALEVDKDLTSNGNLTLVSDAQGTAQVYSFNTGIVRGNATVQRYISTSSNPGLGYRHLSSPVSGTTVATLAVNGGYQPVINAAYNTAFQPSLTVPFPTVYGYDQSRLATAVNNLSAFDKGWISPVNLNAPLVVGRAYTVNLAAGQTINFVGVPNTGDVTVALTRGPSTDAGWHLIGNPYPSNFDLNSLNGASNVDDAKYLFESQSAYIGTYRAYVNGITSNRYVASGQGFFARVLAGASSATLTFTNAGRLSAYSSATSFRRELPETRPIVELALDNGAGLRDLVTMYGQSGATAGVDAAFDAVKLPNTTGLNFASVAATGEALAIDGRPSVAVAPMLIPLTVQVPIAGTYRLQVERLLNLPATTQVELVDNLVGQRLNLRTLPTSGYTFALNATQAAAPIVGRFFLNLTPAAALLASSAALLADIVQISPNPAHTSITMLLPGGTGAGQASTTITDALGRTVLKRSEILSANGSTVVIPLVGLATGLYAVHVQVGGAATTKRLVVE